MKWVRCKFLCLGFWALLHGLTTTFAGFTVTVKSLPSQAKIDATLYREDLDSRNLTKEGTLSLQQDKSYTAAFTGEPGLFRLEISDMQAIPLAIADGQEVVIELRSTNVAGISVSDSTDTDVLHTYESFRKESLARLVYPPRAALNNATANCASPEVLAPLAQAEVDGYSTHKRELNDFTIQNAGTSIALYATSLRWDSDYRIAEIQKQVEAFAKKHSGLVITDSMQERLRTFGMTAIGAIGAPLSGRDIDGETRSLEDFRGKVVLVDFWASWCVPCRVENRHYPKLLEAYSKHGFEVFGINLDESRSSWMRTSHQDGVTWPQVSDLLGLKSPLAQAYNVTALPMSFLFDEEGRIIGRNLRGEALSDTLLELFGEASGK